MGVVKDLTGKVFGRLTAIRIDGKLNRSFAWVCSCECGNSIRVRGAALSNGNTKSCGCLKIEKFKSRVTKHGLHGTPEYIAWKAMKQRCYDPNHEFYHRYGGRGITVDPSWIDNFGAFLAHIGKRPTKNHSVDRIDHERNYEPGNVKWSTPKQQARNTSASVFVTLHGERMTRAEAAERIGWKYIKLRDKMRKIGTIVVDDVLEVPS